LPCWFLEW